MESDELGILSTALRVVYDDLEVVWSEGTSSLMACAINITRMGALAQEGCPLHQGESILHDCSFSLWGQH